MIHLADSVSFPLSFSMNIHLSDSIFNLTLITYFIAKKSDSTNSWVKQIEEWVMSYLTIA